ncbi:MAG: DMT family transporter [Chloroflexi bacterium]|nr:DMT family transporter [Chloroflexota bacterium]
MSRAPLSVRAVAELGVLTAMATWAVNFTVVKAAVLAWPVLPFSAIRITAAGVLVLGWAVVRSANVRMSQRDLFAAALFGVIGQGIYQLLWAGAFGTINAGTSALLIAVTPFLTAILASLLRIDPLKPAVALGGIVAFMGVVAVALGEGAGAFGGETAGVAMTLGAAVCWAVYLLAGARVIPRVGAIAWTAWSMIFGGGALIVIAAAAGQFTDLVAPPPVAIFGLVFATLGSSSVANVLYFTAVPIVGVSRVASFQLLVPFLAVVVSAIVLNEAPAPIQALGGALILLGIWAGRQTTLPFGRRLR